MKVTSVDIDRVKPYPGNPRNNEGAIAKVAASIREFGFRQPIVVDNKMIVIVGHTRLLAARQLGLRKVPIHIADGLDPMKVRAYRLADNRVHEESSWNEAALVAELAELAKFDYDLALTGFNPDEITALLHEGGLLPGADEDAVPEAPARPTTAAGDLIVLGKHRLVCGDCRDPLVIEKLFAGAKADAIFTDPPYNVNYSGAAGNIANDHMKDKAFREFLLQAYAVMFQRLKDGGAIYVCHADTEGLNFRGAFKEAGFKLSGCLIWCKDSLVLGRSDYQWQHEPILYGWKPTSSHKWYGDRKSTTISEFMLQAPIAEIEPDVYRLRLGDEWFIIRGKKLSVQQVETTVVKIPRPKRNEDHPTVKPIALIDKMLLNSTKTDDIVFDAFAGSGSTLISCEKNSRTAYVSELEPKFCDVIVTRWEQATGQKARRQARSKVARAGSR